MDGAGAALVAFALIVVLQATGTHLPGRVVAGVALAGVMAAVMVRRRGRTVPEGFVPAAAVRSPRFVLGALAALTLFASYLALVFAARFWCSPTTTGARRASACSWPPRR